MGEPGVEDSLPVGVCSSKEPALDLVGVDGRPVTLLDDADATESLTGSGEGRGVRSDIAAKYGDAKADPEPWEMEEAILDVESVERNDEPIPGKKDGEVRAGTRTGSVETGVS